MASDELEKKEEMQQTTESLSSDNPEKEPEREPVKESEKETDRLTPESVEQSKKSVSDDSDDEHVRRTPAYSDRNLWKNAFITLVAVILIAAVGFGCWYYVKKVKGSDKKPEEEVTDTDSETKQIGYLKKTAQNIWKSSRSYRSHKDIQFSLQDIRTFCKDNGLMISDDASGKSFIAFNDTMKMIVTVDELQGKTFEELAEELVTSSAPLNSREMVRSDNYIKYEGYLDKDQPEYGYCFLELICSDTCYVFVQGLGDTAADPEISQILIFSHRLESKLGMH